MKKLLGILIIAVLISACGFVSRAAKIAPTEAPPPTEVPSEIVEPTAVTVDTDTPEPVPSLEPILPEPSPTIEVPTIEIPTITVEPTLAVEPWRLPPMSGATFLTNDLVASSDDAKAIAAEGQVLAIPAPFSWEAFNLPDNTRYADVQGYFTPLVLKKGYSIGMDIQGTNDVYLMTFLNKVDPTSKIGIEFQTKKGDRPAMVVVFYKNPK